MRLEVLADTISFSMSTGLLPAVSDRVMLTPVSFLAVVSPTPTMSPESSMDEVAWSTPVCTTSLLFCEVKKPAPSITYEKTAATTTKAMSTIAASRPVKAASFFLKFLTLLFIVNTSLFSCGQNY